MNKKGIILSIIIIAILIVGIWMTKRNNPTPSIVNTEIEQATSTSTEEIINTVIYSDTGFSPKILTIGIGDTVKFINQSKESMWVGSDVHPSHKEYVGTSLKDHCPDTAGTAFDQCGKGSAYSFTFNKLGSWDYHNHSHAGMGGTIVVK